jgi:hypothetical protein
MARYTTVDHDVREYRKYYEHSIGIKLNKNFDVHHIDLNKKNNDILNLVAMPKKLLLFKNINNYFNLSYSKKEFVYEY